MSENASVLVDAAAYVDGYRVPDVLTLDDPSHWRDRLELPERAFVWLGLRMPTDAEMAAAQKIFDLHELAVEDAMGAHIRPKLEVYDDDELFVVVRTARYETTRRELSLGEISIFLGHWFVVAVRHGQASPLSGVRAEVEERPDLLREGPSAVVHAILDRVVTDYEPVLDQLERQVRDLEIDVFSDSRHQPTEQIYNLIRQVLDLLTAVEPLALPLDRLAGPTCRPWVDDEIAPFFRDVSDQLVRVVDRARNLYQLLTTILAANQTEVSIRQNEDMRRISAWIAIAAVPTMVAGIYGMNFEHMPELSWTLGYPLVLLLLVVVCGVMYKKFKDTGWL